MRHHTLNQMNYEIITNHSKQSVCTCMVHLKITYMKTTEVQWTYAPSLASTGKLVHEGKQT